MTIRIAIASDDIGYNRKEEIKRHLTEGKDTEIIFDPATYREHGENTFAALADEMTECIQRDV